MTARQAKKVLRANCVRHSRRTKLAAGRRLCRRYRLKDMRSGWPGWRMGRWDPATAYRDPWLDEPADATLLSAFEEAARLAEKL